MLFGTQGGLHPVLIGIILGDRASLLKRPGVEPSARANGRRPRSVIPVGTLSLRELSVGTMFLGIPLLYQAEPAKLTLMTIEVAVVVGVAGDEAAATDPV